MDTVIFKRLNKHRISRKRKKNIKASYNKAFTLLMANGNIKLSKRLRKKMNKEVSLNLYKEEALNYFICRLKRNRMSKFYNRSLLDDILIKPQKINYINK